MDESVSDQPTLKRFSRYNQSMHSRPSQMCNFEPGSSQQQQPHTCSKVGSRLKTGFFSGNWTLRGKKEQKIRPSVHDINVVQTGKVSSNLTTAERTLVSGGILRSSFPLSPQQHFQYHQCHSQGPSDYFDNDRPTSLQYHGVPSFGRKNFNETEFGAFPGSGTTPICGFSGCYISQSSQKPEKFYTDPVSTPTEIAQAEVIPSQFAAGNSIRFSTSNPSVATEQLEPIISTELSSSNR
uniref:Uncharacterized protein n=1 Tax=Setaria digitata TaxID=48799 RepID=A0A915PIF4_9BILA